MSKKYVLPIIFIMFLSGCSNISGEEAFSNNIKAIEHALKKPDWNQIESLGDDLKKLYNQSEWKIQLLGDEDEYEGLQESINQLIAAIEEKEIPEIKLELATVKTFLDNIYSM